jgi:hypothetical protein
MACSSCKKKETFKNEIKETGDLVSKKIVWFAIIWSILGLYGLYSLVTKFI